MARGVIRLLDPVSGQPFALRPARGGAFRLHCRTISPGTASVGTASVGTALTAAAVRILLIGDLILRIGELDSLTVDLGWETGTATGVDAVVAALALHRPTAHAAGASGRPGDAEAPDLLVEPRAGAAHPPDGAADGVGAPGRRIGAADVIVGVDGARDPLAEAEAVGVDPLALRLVLLETYYGTPVTVTPHTLADADAVLTKWRRLVAEWAEHPSRAMPSDVVGAVRAAWDTDLDIPGALAALRTAAAAPAIPPGALFELFAYADRVLALDLVREVGR